MARMRAAARRVQAWIELRSEDPEATSALAVAVARLVTARGLESLRRFRVFELAGALPARATIEDLLHRSTQFYNPHKERCTLRLRIEDLPPLAKGESAVLVWDRGGERRPAAERWWLHETGRKIEVREGVAWAPRFAGGSDPADAIRELAVVRDRRHGLLCNPHAQESRIAFGEVPLPWIVAERASSPAAEGGEE
jgi:hypothetical protein